MLETTLIDMRQAHVMKSIFKINSTQLFFIFVKVLMLLKILILSNNNKEMSVLLKTKVHFKENLFDFL